jgi:hypothetical protein
MSYPPPRRDINDDMMAFREYARSQEDKAILRNLRALSPALEAMVERIEEELRSHTKLIKDFISSHETRMRRLERKLERGFTRLETRICDLETSLRLGENNSDSSDNN